MICKVFSFSVRSRKKQRNAGSYDLIGDLFRSHLKQATDTGYYIDYKLFNTQQFYAVNPPLRKPHHSAQGISVSDVMYGATIAPIFRGVSRKCSA